MKRTALFALPLIFSLMFAAASHAQDRTLFIPIIKEGSQLEALAPADVVDRRLAFTLSSQTMNLFTVNDDNIYVLKSILIAPEMYPETRAPISIRFCEFGGGCSHSWKVPNDNVTQLDFGIGEVFDSNGSYYIDINDRGGLPETASNQINVQVSAYRLDR